MAFALGHAAAAAAAAPAVDVESLLWELRDLLRGLGQVNASQAAQLAQLAPESSIPYDAVTEEYAERTRVALEAVDVALNQMRLAPVVEENAAEDDWSEFDDSNVRAWLHSTQLALEQPQASATQAAVPESADDFWNTDSSFKWDDEPELDTAPLDFLDPSEPQVMDDSLSVLDDDAVSPWDSVSVRELDLDYQSSFNGHSDELPHGSTGDDSATLFHSEPLEELHHPIVSSLPTKMGPFARGSPAAADRFAARPEILAGF